MAAQRAVTRLLLLAVAPLACTTVYTPPEAPLTEAGLAEAIQTLGESRDRLELLEDGLRAVAYVYDRKRAPRFRRIGPHERLWDGAMFPEDWDAQTWIGPPHAVYLPYASIRSVEARSWPLWAGVELAFERVDDGGPEGPVVIQARDREEAQRLADAIDRLRRARHLLSAETAADADAR